MSSGVDALVADAAILNVRCGSLAQKYDVGDEIGSGSYGRALVAIRHEDGEKVVIKEIRLSDMDEKQQQEALSECKVLSQFEHVNIVRYYEAVLEVFEGWFFEGLVVSLSLLIILDILSFSWYAMMTERLGSLVRVIFEILKETVYFLFLLGMLIHRHPLPSAFLTLPQMPTRANHTTPLHPGLERRNTEHATTGAQTPPEPHSTETFRNPA
eukprot:gene11862-14968_t